MGKCFSACNRGQRNKSDFYQTPYSMTEQLLENEKFNYNQTFLEPACGNLAITKILEKYFKNGYSAYDIKDNIHYSKLGCCVHFSCKLDFFNENHKYDYIITNLPFSLALEFIQKSKEIANEKFAMLLPLSYLHGQKRYEKKIFLDENYPLTKIYVFTRYPLLEETIREDGKYKTGMIAYAWYIWENMPKVRFIHPHLKWINNQKYILSKKDIKA